MLLQDDLEEEAGSAVTLRHLPSHLRGPEKACLTLQPIQALLVTQRVWSKRGNTMLNWLSWFPRRMIRTQGEGKKGKLQLGPHILRSELQAGHTGQAKRSPNQPAYHQ